MNVLRFRAYSASIPLTYTPVALLTISGDPNDTDATAMSINSNAIVGGHGRDANGNIVGAKWTLTSPKNLGTLGGPGSNIFSINDAGCVCGMAIAADGTQRAALWVNNLIRDLGTLTGTSGSSVAYAMTEGMDPLVFGESTDSAGIMRAVRWSNLSAGILPQNPDWTSSSARSAGPNGWGAGWAALENGDIRSYFWDGSPTEISGLPNASITQITSDYYQVSQFVGDSNRGPGSSLEAVYLAPGTPAISMQTIPGTTTSLSRGVNSYGIAVGEYGANGVGGGFVCQRYPNVEMVDLTSRLALNSFVDKIVTAFDINNDGIITALAEDSNGVMFAVLLLPN